MARGATATDTGRRSFVGRRIFNSPDRGDFSQVLVGIRDGRINGGLETNIPTVFGGEVLPFRVAADIIAMSRGFDPETGRRVPGFANEGDASLAAELESGRIGFLDMAKRIIAERESAKGGRAVAKKKNPFVEAASKGAEISPRKRRRGVSSRQDQRAADVRSRKNFHEMTAS